MPRYIDADALRARMYHEAFETDTDMQKWDSGCWIRYKLFENCIDEQPTISPDEVRGVGKWIEKEVYNLEYTTIEQMQSACCSVCGKYHTTPYSYYFSKYNYCPFCGARLGNGGTDDS